MRPVDPLAYWYFAPARQTFLCAPPKCGSSALAIRYFGAESAGDLQARSRTAGFGAFRATDLGDRTARRWLAVRDPVERFASLWRNKCRDELTPNGIPAVHGMSPAELLAYIARYPFGNLHWFPQIAYYAPGVEPVQAAAFFKRLDLDAPLNTTAKAPTDPPMPADDVRRLFRNDVDLWRAACSK